MEKSHRGGRKNSAAKHSGGGMPYFEREHWQKDVADVDLGQHRYSSEFGQAEEYKKSVDALAKYVKGHKAQH